MERGSNRAGILAGLTAIARPGLTTPGARGAVRTYGPVVTVAVVGLGLSTLLFLLAQSIQLAAPPLRLDVSGSHALVFFEDEWLPSAVLFAGILLTLVMTIYLAATLRRAAQIEAVVALRTQELSDSKARTQELNATLLASLARQRRLTSELSSAKSDAVAANQAKTDFLANMSHEIRTPMTAILGFAETLETPDLAEAERVEALATIRRNGRHLLQIVNDILDVSKIEAGKITLESIPCSPRQLAEEVSELLRPRAQQKGLAFQVQFAAPLPEMIRSDPTRLRQVLVNLVGNAIKFTQAGEVRLVVSALPAEPGSSRVSFSVFDTGPGMQPGAIERLFQPFTQADCSTTRRFGGTGLGLTISKRLAEMLGGDIFVESQPGRGSCFTAMIHAPVVEPSATADSADMTVAGGGAAILCGRVLLVEDGPDNQRLLTFLLKRFGLEVEIANHGREALEKALPAHRAGRPFDVILMDMQMPELDGYEATGMLRDEGYDAPIVALTAHAMVGARERCLAAGCDDFATKPIDRDTLLGLLRKHMGGSAGNTVELAGRAQSSNAEC